MGQGHTHLEDECTDSEEEKFYNSELEDSQSECEEDACDKRVTMEARARQATAARLRSVWNEAKKNSSDSASEYEEAEEDRGLQPPLAERSSPLGASHSDGNTSFRGPELTDAEDEQGCTEACRYQQAYFFGSNTSLDSSISQPSCASLDSRLAQISGSSNTYHSRALPRNFFLDLEREGRGCASASATPLTSPQSPSETRRRWDKSVWPEVEKGLRRNQSVPDIDPSRSEDRRHRVRGRSPSPKRYTFDEREKRQKIIDAVTRRLYPGSGPGFGRRNKKVSEKPQVLGERECRCRKKPGSDGDISASKNSVTTSSCELLIPKIPRKISLPTPVTPPAWRRSSLESPPGSFLPIPVRDHSQAERTSTSPQKESASTTLTRSSRITRREVKTVTTTVTKTLNTIERKIMTNVQQDMTKPDMQDQAVDCDLVDRDSCEKVSCESKGAQADMQVLETSEDQEENDDSQSPKKCVHPDPDLLTDVNENDSAEKEGRRKIPLTPALHQLRQALASLNDPERFSDDSLELGNLDADSPSPASRFSPRAPEEDEISLGDISKDSLEDSVNIDVESRKLHAAHDPTVVQEITACDIVSAMPGPRIPKLSKKHDSFIQSFFRSVSASDMKDSFELEEESLSLTDDNSETLCLSPSSAQTLASKPSVPVKPNSVTPPPSSSSSRNTRRWTRERAEKRFVESTSSEESDVDSRQRPRFRKRRVRRMSLPLPSVPTMDLCEDQDNSDCTDGAALKLSSHETVDSAVCASVKDINANKMLTRTQSKELLDRNRRYTSESVGECGVEDVSVDIASTERKQKLLQFKQKYKNESSQPSNQDSSVVESMSPEYYSPHLQDPVISVPSQAGSNQQFSESDSFSDRDVETQTLLKESARKLLRTVSKEGPLSEASQDAVAELLKASSKRLAKYALSMPEDGSEIGSASLSRCESVATQDEDYDTAKGEDSWLESSSEFQSALKKNGVSGSHSYTSNTTTPARELLNKDEKKQSLEGQGNLLDVVQSSSGGDVSPRAFAADGTDYSTTATTPLASSASEGFSTEGSWEDLDILDPHSKGDVNLSEKQYQVIAAEFTPRTARRLLYTIIECSESSRSESVPSEPDIIPSDWQETMSETEDYNMSACMSPEISEDLLSSSDDTMLDTVRRNVEDPQDSLSCISDDILGDSKAHTAEGYPAESFQELPWNAAGSLELLTSLPITPDCLDEEDNPWETDTKVPRLTTAVAVEFPWQKIDDVSHSSHPDDYLVPVMTSGLKAESSQDSDMEFDSLEQIQETYTDVQHPQCTSDIPQSYVLEGDNTEAASSVFNKSTSSAAEAQRLISPLTLQNPLMGPSETASTLTPKDKDVEASCQHLNLQTASESTEVAQSGLDPMVTDQSSEKEIKQAPPLTPQNSVMETQPLTVEEAMTPKALEVAMEEASYLQEVTDSTPKLVKEGSGQAATLNTPNVAVEREASEKAGILQTSQMSEVAIPTISQLAIGEVMSLQTMPHQALPLTVEEDRSVQVVPLTTPPLAIEKSGNVQLIPQSQHMALEENRREHEVIFHPVTSTLSVEESPPVTPLTPEIATGVLVTSHEFPVEGSSSDWTMTYQTAEVSSDQALPHKTPVIVMGKARSAQETAQINVDGTAHAQASIQQMSQMALEGVVVQTPTHQAETSSLDLEESHAVIPLLPQKTTTVRAVTHQTSHISEQGILQSPQVATETCPDQTKTLQAPQVAVETSIVPTGTHTAPQVAKETISGQTAIVQEPILALETSIDQTVIHQTPQMTVESGYGQSLRTPVEASNCQAVTSQVSRAVAKTLQTPQSAVETNFGEAVISPNMGINVRTVDMAKTEGKSVQELKYLDSHSVMEEAGSAQTMPQVAKERIDSAQAVNQTSEMVMEKTRTLAQQAAISHIGLEDRHAVIPLLPEEMSRMPVVIHKMPHVVNEEMSSAQAMASSVQAVTPQTLQMGESTSAQPAFVQTSQMITPETSRAQAVLQQAVTSDIDLKEMHFVKPLLPQDTDSLRAVMRQTSQVTEEGTSSAHAVIQQAVSSELDLEDSHTVLSLLPQDTITARTVVHQAAQKAKEGMASAQIMFVTPQMPLGEVSSTRAVTQQAASSKLHLDETHSVIPLVPQDTGNVRAVIHQTTHMTKEGNDSIQAVSAQATQMAMGEDGSAQVLALQTSQIATARADSAQAVTVQIPQIAAVGTSSVQPGTAHMTRMAMKETCSAQLVTHQTPQMTMGEAGSVQTVTAQTPQMAMDGTSGAQVTGQRTQAGVDRVSSAHAVTIHTPQLAMEGASSAQAVSQVALEEVGSAQAIRQAVSSQLGLLETDSVIPLLPQDADTFKAVICQTPQVATEGMDSTQTVIGQTPQMTLGGASSTQAVTVHQMAMGKAGSAQAVTIQAPQIAMEGILSAQAVTNDQIAQAMNVHTRQIPVREASSTQAENLHTPQMALREASSAETVTAQITQMAMGEASSAQALVLQTPQMVMGKTSSAQAVILETPKAVIQQAVSSQQSLEEIHFLSPLLPQDTNSVRTVIRQTPQTEKEGTSSAQTVIQQAVTSQLCLDETHALAKEGMGSTQTVIVQTPQMVIGEACSDQTVTLEAYQLATESVINTQTTPIRRLEIAKEESSSAQAVTVLTPQMSTIVTSSEQAVINQIPQMPMIPTSSEQAVIDQTHQMSMIPTSSEQVITDQKLQTTVIVPRSAGAVIQYAVTSRSDLDESQSVISLLPQDSNFRAVIHQTPQEGAIRHQAVTLQTPQMTKGKTSSDQTGSVRPVIGSVSQVAMDEETVGGVSSAHAMTVQTPQMALETGSAQAVSLETPQMTFGDCSDQAVTVQTPQMA
ncbi:hypothetical protein C7M84_007960 [Penaeus vannamei]|uniref:Uncharacterized protein n=1 Tax=Penaeus vannamei TaxID=6689 RepID=A0A3R7P2H5_PENVA|nr:hypothetical protein C7M84_007960 [Penaeus vannamei]